MNSPVYNQIGDDMLTSPGGYCYALFHPKVVFRADIPSAHVQAQNFYIRPIQLSRKNKGYFRIFDMENHMKLYANSTGKKLAEIRFPGEPVLGYDA
jgi:hypothetical protein